MDTATRRELDGIKEDLNAIIRELEGISSGVRSDFLNVGNDKCANSIDSVIAKYRYVKTKLNNMDTDTVTAWFKSLTAQ